MAAIGPVGYVSSFVSAGRCERVVADRAAQEIGTRSVFALPVDAQRSADTYPGSAAILRSAGLSVRECTATGDADFDCFPWIGVSPAEAKYPFMLEVRWGFVAIGTSGYGTRSRYVAIFGALFHLGDYGGWAA